MDDEEEVVEEEEVVVVVEVEEEVEVGVEDDDDESVDDDEPVDEAAGDDVEVSDGLNGSREGKKDMTISKSDVRVKRKERGFVHSERARLGWPEAAARTTRAAATTVAVAAERKPSATNPTAHAHRQPLLALAYVSSLTATPATAPHKNVSIYNTNNYSDRLRFVRDPSDPLASASSSASSSTSTSMASARAPFSPFIFRVCSLPRSCFPT